MRLTNISVSRRLWFAVLPPILAMAYLASVQVAGMWSNYRQMHEVVIVSDSVKLVGDMIHTLQVERGLSAGFLGSKGKNGRAELAQARTASDSALARFPSFIDTVATLGDDDVSTAIERSREKLAEIGPNRAQIDALTFSGKQSFEAYTGTIKTLGDLVSALSLRGVSSPIAAEIIAYNQLMKAKEIAGQERGTANSFINAGQAQPNQIEAFAKMAGAQDALIDSFVSLQNKSLHSSYANMLHVPMADTVNDIRHQILASQGGDGLSKIDSKVWFAAASQRIEAMKALESESLSISDRSPTHRPTRHSMRLPLSER